MAPTPGRRPVLGPVKCQGCHSRVYWMGDRWGDREFYRTRVDGRNTNAIRYKTHACTARTPTQLEAVTNLMLAYRERQ